MRVTDRIKFDAFKNNLALIKSNLDKTQNKIASGKKILVPSDDPVSSSVAVGFNAEKGLNAQYRRNIERLKTTGVFYETSINSVNNMLTRAKEIAIVQASDTVNAETRKSAGEEVKGIIERLVAIGNTKVGNHYIFGGKKSNNTPFSIDSDYNVTFNGSNEVSSIFVDKGTKEDAGISGDKVFISDTNIFNVLKNFKDALETNNKTGIRNALDGLDKSLEKTQTNLVHVGTYTARIENFIEYNESKNNNIIETLSQIMDVDVAQAVVDFNSLSNAYEAMIYTMTKIQNLSVLNYLR
ncbi:MAG TPA: flagellar hook-associated protein FlgL [Syntrophorhabdaceae bacterium]|nr:flagellar hook-associated protein FlgL [Syntrophorhabdaceae bacterium]HOG39615.1 flagellar hook-associated protein FlgL [Syntrophorhabdaceae bacterium]